MDKKNKKIFWILAMFLIALPMVHANASLSIEKNIYYVGDIVLINIDNFNQNYSVEISFGENIYRYLGSIDNTFKFMPSSEGIYDVKLYYLNDVIYEKTFNVSAKPNENKIPELLFPTEISPEYINKVNLEDIYSNLAGLFNENMTEGNYFDVSNIYDNKIKITNNKNQLLKSQIIFYKNNLIMNNKNILDIQNEIINPDSYDVEIVPVYNKIKNIELKNLNYTGTMYFGIDEVPAEKIKIIDNNKEKNVANVFAVNPEKINFDSGFLTYTAEGDELYKCKDWDFSNQQCNGQWVKILDTVPGNEYTINISKQDPGYGEAVTATHVEFHNHGFINITAGIWGDEFFQDGATYSNSITLYNARSSGYRFNLSSAMSGKTVSGFRIFISARSGTPPATYNVMIHPDDGTGLPNAAIRLCNATFATPGAAGWVATGAASGGTCALSTGRYYHVIVNATLGGAAANSIQIGYTAQNFRSDALYESYTPAGGWAQTAVSEPIVAIAFSDGTYYGNTFTTRTNSNIYAGNYAGEYFRTSALGFYIQNLSFSLRCLSGTDPADDLDLNISYAGNNSNIFSNPTIYARTGCSGTGYFLVTLNLSTPLYLENNTAFRIFLNSPSSVVGQYYRVDEESTTAAAPYNTISFDSTNSYFSNFAAGAWVDDTSSDMYFTFQLLDDNDAPVIVLDNPPNDTWTKNNTVVFYYNVSDSTRIDNCSLILNGTRNTTSPVNTKTFYPGNFTLNSMRDGDYLWTVNCTDRFGNQGTNSSWKLLHIDTTPPNITLNNPQNNSFQSSEIITFTYTPSDGNLKNCTLFGNFSGVWTANQTNTTPLNYSQNNFYVNLSYGNYIWNVRCYDVANNQNFSSTNFTLRVAGNLMVNDSSIVFSNSTPVENQNITIFATVWNQANRTQNNISIQFYNGDPAASGRQIGRNITVNMSGNSSVTVNITWLVGIGYSNIFVIVDQYGSIYEWSESDNKKNNSIFLTAWHIYYGNTSTVYVLGNANSTEIVLWNTQNISGNIYVSDSDSSVTWTSLQALGRNTTGGVNANTQNDFQELDLLLGMENLTDSVNLTYTVGGNPIETATYTVYSRNITNVPQVSSTNNTNFKTGILWDSQDSTNTYYDTANKEDIVFVAKINQQMQGKYGRYDYEIRVPAKLRQYIATTNTIAFYYELI